MRRVVVVGCSGAGKTTLARRLAGMLDVPHIELDAIFHQSGWRQLDNASFQAELSTRMAASPRGWVICGNYVTHTAGMQFARADTLVWVDPTRSLVMWRVITRTVWRGLTRKELWNGNRERLANLIRWDPEQSVIRWAWVKWPQYRERYARRMTDGSWDHLTVHRLTTNAEIAAFFEEVARASVSAAPAQSSSRSRPRWMA